MFLVANFRTSIPLSIIFRRSFRELKKVNSSACFAGVTPTYDCIVYLLHCTLWKRKHKRKYRYFYILTWPLLNGEHYKGFPSTCLPSKQLKETWPVLFYFEPVKIKLNSSRIRKQNETLCACCDCQSPTPWSACYELVDCRLQILFRHIWKHASADW